LIKHCLIPVLLFTATAATAQTFGNADTLYIKQFQKQNNIQVNAWNTDVDFILNPQLKNKDFSVRISPNVRNQIGFSFGLKKITLFIGGQIPGTDLNINPYGKTRFIDFSFGYFKNRWGGEIYYRNFDGLYRAATDASPIGALPNTRLTNYGLSLFYALNNRFSYRSAISQQEQQRISSGSFVLLGNMHHRSLVSGSSVIPSAIDSIDNFGSLTGLIDIRFFTLNIRPGYGHNFVFRNGLYFISPSIFAGAGIGTYEYLAKAGRFTGFSTDFDFHAKLTAGINHHKWFASIFVVYDRSLNVFNTKQVSLQTVSYGINLGVRLNSFFRIKWL
jgi:hypothetical protein